MRGDTKEKIVNATGSNKYLLIEINKKKYKVHIKHVYNILEVKMKRLLYNNRIVKVRDELTFPVVEARELLGNEPLNEEDYNTCMLLTGESDRKIGLIVDNAYELVSDSKYEELTKDIIMSAYKHKDIINFFS